jgi:DNA polymerase III epsilon subunit-like protein
VLFPRIPFVVIDTETTGFLPRVHKVIEVACARYEEGALTQEWEQLLSTDDEIPPHVEVLTRIRKSDLGGRPRFPEIVPLLQKLIPDGTLIVGQNIGFDIEMLRGEGLDLRHFPHVDTSLLASLAFPELRSCSLAYLSTALSLRHDPKHRALGDVRATMELFGRCWERLLSLSDDKRKIARETFLKSTPGYRMLFGELPSDIVAGSALAGFSIREISSNEQQATNQQSLVHQSPVASRQSQVASRKSQVASRQSPVALSRPPVGTVDVREESLSPNTLAEIVSAAAPDEKTDHWIAVKNLELMLRRLDLPTGVRVLHPPFLLPDSTAVRDLFSQEEFSPEEATLAVKMQWHTPETRADLSLHAGERDVWAGKIACTDISEKYLKQFQPGSRVYLLDHRQLLSILAEEHHPARKLFTKHTHIVIDDASMLEDTATKAYGASVQVAHLRAAARTLPALTILTDLLEIWIQKISAEDDLHILTGHDLSRPEGQGLLQQIDDALDEAGLPTQTKRLLKDLRLIFCADETTLRWTERRRDGTFTITMAPLRIDAFLDTHLYEAFAVTLLAPKGGSAMLPETLPIRAKITEGSPVGPQASAISLAFPEATTANDILKNPPSGKTVLLLPSKRVIEQHFIRHTESLEKRGVTIICQGFAGGQGRMEEEFLAAEGCTLLLMTPWMYEGTELPAGSVDHLILDQLPFDMPGYPVLKARAEHYEDGFSEYQVPRLLARLFRLIRTYCRQKTPEGDVTILDQRIAQRSYGERVRTYVEEMLQASIQKTPSRKPRKEKSEPEGQQSLF